MWLGNDFVDGASADVALQYKRPTLFPPILSQLIHSNLISNNVFEIQSLSSPFSSPECAVLGSNDVYGGLVRN